MVELGDRLPFIAGLLLSFHQYKRELALAARQKTTNGIIDAHEPANHNRYGYSFAVDGKSYRGSETPKKTEPKIGQPVVVYYDPRDPNTNALTDFRDLSEGSLSSMSLPLLGIIGVFSVIAFLRWRHFLR